MKRRLLATIVFFLMALSGICSTTACPNCKDSYAAGSPDAKIGESYSVSILLMLSVPMVLLGGIGFVVWSKARKHQLSSK